jgi:hypothetical protein
MRELTEEEKLAAAFLNPYGKDRGARLSSRSER